MDEIFNILNTINQNSVHQSLNIEFRIENADYIYNNLNADITAAVNMINNLINQGNIMSCEVDGPREAGDGVNLRFIINEV